MDRSGYLLGFGTATAPRGGDGGGASPDTVHTRAAIADGEEVSWFAANRTERNDPALIFCHWSFLPDSALHSCLRPSSQTQCICLTR